MPTPRSPRGSLQPSAVSFARQRLTTALVPRGQRFEYRLDRAAQRPQRSQQPVGADPTLRTQAGDSVFMLKKLEAVKRELRAGTGVDADQYRSLLNVRTQVNERYTEAIEWLRRSGRED